MVREPRMIMKALALSLGALTSMDVAVAASNRVDWAQPPVACVEELVPRVPERACPDLTRVPDPRVDWPTDLPEEEAFYWQGNKRGENYCRSVEIMRREDLRPGTFPAAAIQLAWMRLRAVANSDLKVRAVYQASRAQKIPVQILAGALTQESLFSDLGIAEDGGNFSCGIGQINLSEWCRWASKQSAKKKAEMGWPSHISCSSVSAGLISPFYDIAKTRLAGMPEYRLEKVHFQNIPFELVVRGFPSGSAALQRLRFQAARSFLDNCMDVTNGISAKANELKNLYVTHVPAGLRSRDQYAPGKEYQRTCADKGYTGSYPLSTGWLLAVGIYNAGPRSVDALAHYNGWTEEKMTKPATWKNFTPAELVEAFYWSGRYNPADDRIHFTTLNGGRLNWIWFKPCVLQRHIARVVQHVTLSGSPKLVDTLEGAYKCAKSVFDPQTGKLVKSSVPSQRQKSSGVKERTRKQRKDRRSSRS